ncbi:MAG: hypothetical protein WC308_01710 [archaeon]|jgi:hypothetical protein
MQKKVRSFAQGTIEYIVLLAIIVVIGLVVVVLSSSFVDAGQGINSTKSEQYWSVQDVGVVNSAVDANGDGLFSFKNTGVGDVTITSLNVDGQEIPVSDAKIPAGGSKNFLVENLPSCPTGTTLKSYSVKITYKDQYGIQKTVDGTTELVVNCQQNVDENSSPTPPVIVDNNAPVVNLVSPASGTKDSDGVVSFSYSAIDNFSGIYDCSLLINNSVDQTDYNSPFNSFEKTFSSKLVYYWNVRCTDKVGNIGSGGQNNSVSYCHGEGDMRYAILNEAPCCDGLDAIEPKSGLRGVYGYCTANCGNGVCDTNIESFYNCPGDCAPPSPVVLSSPASGSVDSDGTVVFQYSNPLAHDDTNFCELIVDGAVWQTSNYNFLKFVQIFTEDSGYAWDINCMDINGVVHPSNSHWTVDVEGVRICNEDTECESGEFCNFESCAAETGACMIKPTKCLTELDNVCGCNGNTYSWYCAAYSAGTSIDHYGPC